MTAASTTAFDEAAAVRLPDARLRALYATKAAGIGVLFGLLVWIDSRISAVAHPVGMSVAALFVLVPTLAVIVVRRAVRDSLLAAGLIADIVGVTIAVHYGGGADNSSGPILYVVLIALAGMAISARTAFRVAAGCTLAYALLVGAEQAHLLPHHAPYEKTTEDAIATVVIVGAYIFFVAWLVSYAARRVRALSLHVEEMQGETLGARSVTVFVSDVEGFTAMTERLGDRTAHRLIEQHNRIVRQAARRHDGIEVEMQGDSFVIAFASAAGAVRCAAEVQMQLEEQGRQAREHPVRVRIGLYTGEAYGAGERLFGTAVREATRVSRLAGGGEVALSTRVRDLVGEQLSVLRCPYAIVESRTDSGSLDRI